MPDATLISVDEYLATGYRPDREFIDGELIERNVGEYDHSNLQTALASWMRLRQREWNIRVLAEQRIRVTASRFRVPDICVVTRDQVREPESAVLEIPGTPIRIPLPDLFADLD